MPSMALRLGNLQREKKLKCPFCFERVYFVIDLSRDGNHSYTEDCEVCCHPIDVSFEVEDHRLVQFEVQKSHSES